jgi:hypothetical protein
VSLRGRAGSGARQPPRHRSQHCSCISAATCGPCNKAAERQPSDRTLQRNCRPSALVLSRLNSPAGLRSLHLVHTCSRAALRASGWKCQIHASALQSGMQLRAGPCGVVRCPLCEVADLQPGAAGAHLLLDGGLLDVVAHPRLAVRLRLGVRAQLALACSAHGRRARESSAAGADCAECEDMGSRHRGAAHCMQHFRSTATLQATLQATAGCARFHVCNINIAKGGAPNRPSALVRLR